MSGPSASWGRPPLPSVADSCGMRRSNDGRGVSAGLRIGVDQGAGGPELLPIALGPGLRPVVLGVGGDSTLAKLGKDAVSPQLLLGVHAYDGRLLGYFVAETVCTGSCGGVGLGPLTLGDAVVLARRTGDALSLVGLRRSAHHGVVALPDGNSTLAKARARSEYLDALRPLTRLGLGRMGFTEKDGNLEPSLARAAAAATAEALVLRTLAALPYRRAPRDGRDPRSDAACPDRRGRARAPGGTDPLACRARRPREILLVGASLWRLWQREATAIRARAMLPLGATLVAPGAWSSCTSGA